MLPASGARLARLRVIDDLSDHPVQFNRRQGSADPADFLARRERHEGRDRTDIEALTKPGLGFPKDWENQKRWNGGWVRKANGRIEPRMGAKWRILAKIFGG